MGQYLPIYHMFPLQWIHTVGKFLIFALDNRAIMKTKLWKNVWPYLKFLSIEFQLALEVSYLAPRNKLQSSLPSHSEFWSSALYFCDSISSLLFTSHFLHFAYSNMKDCYQHASHTIGKHSTSLANINISTRQIYKMDYLKSSIPLCILNCEKIFQSFLTWNSNFIKDPSVIWSYFTIFHLLPCLEHYIYHTCVARYVK